VDANMKAPKERIKKGQAYHIAPLNRLPLLRFRPGGVSRSWSYEARPSRKYNHLGERRKRVNAFL